MFTFITVHFDLNFTNVQNNIFNEINTKSISRSLRPVMMVGKWFATGEEVSSVSKATLRKKAPGRRATSAVAINNFAHFQVGKRLLYPPVLLGGHLTQQMVKFTISNTVLNITSVLKEKYKPLHGSFLNKKNGNKYVCKTVYSILLYFLLYFFLCKSYSIDHLNAIHTFL